MQPEGVHGRSPGRPLASRPADTGVSPSTSLPASMSVVRCEPLMWSGSGKLEQDARHAVVGVELVQERDHVVFSGIGGEMVGEPLDPDLGRRFLLAADVHRGGGVVTDEYGCESRAASAPRNPGFDLIAQFGANLLGDGFAVNERCSH